MILNDGQQAALGEILASFEDGKQRHLLTGFAGTGKTTLMQAVVRSLVDKGVTVVVTAPTHKAVHVLAGKLAEAGLSHVESMTIHSLLGLKPAAGDSERSVLKRSGRSKTDEFKAVVIDECSMLGADLQGYIDNDLRRHWVLYVGDPAQLPPVGEDEASCFKTTKGKSHLANIVRQAADNPILKAATALREQQGGAVDWSWCKAEEAPPFGVYLAGDDASDWMRDAFTSAEFKADNDAFRYVAWTNARVNEVNARVRSWIYGETPTPFVPGERVLCRAPVLNPGGMPVISTNEEVPVVSIAAGIATFRFDKCAGGAGKQELAAWTYDMPVWKVELQHPEAGRVVADLPRNPDDAVAMDRRLVSEAKVNRSRWFDRFQAKERIADLRSVYAMTAHVSQGSSFGNCFLDVADCRKRERSNPLEMQRLLYVAATRPRFALVLVGA